MAAALAGCGANIAFIARNKAKADALIASLNIKDRAIAAEAEVVQRASLEKAAEAVIARFGRVDALLNCAGANDPRATTQADRSFFDLPEEALRYVVDLNLMGTILPCQVFGRQMAQQGEGVVLNISSMSSFRPLTRVIGYSAAKAAVNNFTQWLAVHLATQCSPNIRVNALAPGFFLTDQNRYLLTEKETGKLTARGQSIIDHTPMRRFGAPEDLLGAVLWLLSPASAFVTGTVVAVDGGFSAFAGV